MSETDIQEIAQTIAEYRVLAAQTGEWRGFEQSFSNDGVNWAEYLLATEEHPHPLLASATVHRDGFVVPIRVVIGWDESLPAVDEWREAWDRSPHALFGAAAARMAYLRAFPEFIAAKPSGAERMIAPPVVEKAAPVDRNWDVALDAAVTPDEVAALWAEARKARTVTVQLERAFKARREVIRAATGDIVGREAGRRRFEDEHAARAGGVEAPRGVVAPKPAPSPAQVAAAARRSRERSAA
ncbi:MULTISPECIES: hypothetical protein [Cryobacterium]|uniref:hypothetical protein n=1 Tax=Cryobacterium TaxID=69578 RepID=UPI000CD40BCE|nr:MULTISPECIES: hypothetical protein [Cryobacterium]POH63611.1 hypothetical protein C3B60_15955 [Cryobacterium zongtaii]TFC44069.1 hypothetical protein E3O57_11550 [Cryobacterium sp. TMN-39-2]